MKSTSIACAGAVGALLLATVASGDSQGFGTYQAMPAAAFVGTMGIDISLRGTSAQIGETAERFSELGISHARLPLMAANPGYERNVRAFVAVNPSVHFFGLTRCTAPLSRTPKPPLGPADIAAFQAATGDHLDYIEGVNEPNGQHDATWVPDTQSCLAPFASARVANLPIVAPAMIAKRGGSDESALGDLSSFASFGNIHRYYNGRDPGTPGWGGSDACGKYGSLSWTICLARINTPGKPVVITETGWNSEREVDELTQAKYISRVFFVDAQAGIAATSIYSFRAYNGGDSFGGTGLLRSDNSEKPAFTAMANVAHILADPSGAGYSPAALAMSVSPAPVQDGQGLRAFVLGKSGGAYDIAIWQEVQSANPDQRGVDTAPAPIGVTLSFPQAYHATKFAWQDDGTAPASQLGSASQFHVPVTDRMTILEVRP